MKRKLARLERVRTIQRDRAAGVRNAVLQALGEATAGRETAIRRVHELVGGVVENADEIERLAAVVEAANEVMEAEQARLNQANADLARAAVAARRAELLHERARRSHAAALRQAEQRETDDLNAQRTNR